MQQHNFVNPYDPRNLSINIKSVAGYMLYDPDDLPTGPHQWSKLAYPKQHTSKKNCKQENKSNNKALIIANTATGNRVDVTPERYKGISPSMSTYNS